MTCTNKAHYPPHLDGPELYDPHLHLAGPLFVGADGKVYVLPMSACIRGGDR